MWSTLVLALLLAAPDLIIRSSTSCPDAAAVVREVTPLLPPGATVAAGDVNDHTTKEIDRADVSVGARTRWLRVRTSSGHVSREREIPASLTCDEAAKAAAVLLAAWQFRGDAELPPMTVTAAPSATTPPPLPPRAGPTASPVEASRVARSAVTAPAVRQAAVREASAPEASVPEASAREPSANVLPRPVTVATATGGGRAAPAPTVQRTSMPAPAPAVSSPGAPWRLAIGAGFSAGRAANQFPMNAVVEASFARPNGLGLRAQVARSSRYSLDLAPGRATWIRSSASVGGAFTGRSGAWGGQVHVDLVGAWLSISGEEFGINEDSHQVAAGGTVGGRVIRGFGPADLWLELAFTAWPGRNQVFLRDAAGSLDLSTFEAFLGLGADFFVWP